MLRATLTNPETYRHTTRFASLDGLRCASILAVIWHHSAAPLPGFAFSGRGFLGVDMFFVLSGFLIVTLLLRERDRTTRIALGQFYLRRALRIFPVYFALLAGLVAACAAMSSSSSLAEAYFTELPYYVSYTSNWIGPTAVLAITWSLAAEEQFYLLWPPLEKLLRGARLYILLLGFIALNQLVNFRLADAHLQAWFGIGQADLNILQSTFTPICLGVLLAHLLHSPRGFAVISRLVGFRAAPLLAAAALIAACSIPGDVSGLPRLLIHLLMMTLLASCVVREDHLLQPMLTLSFVQRIGVVSYGMYLYHMLALQFVMTIAGNALELSLALFAITTALTILAAEISYRAYELPFLRLKDRLGKHPLPWRAAAGWTHLGLARCGAALRPRALRPVS